MEMQRIEFAFRAKANLVLPKKSSMISRIALSKKWLLLWSVNYERGLTDY